MAETALPTLRVQVLPVMLVMLALLPLAVSSRLLGISSGWLREQTTVVEGAWATVTSATREATVAAEVSGHIDNERAIVEAQWRSPPEPNVWPHREVGLYERSKTYAMPPFEVVERWVDSPNVPSGRYDSDPLEKCLFAS